MSDANKGFSRRRSVIHFRPKGGIGHGKLSFQQQNEQSVEELGDKLEIDKVFDKRRHEREIEKAENILAEKVEKPKANEPTGTKETPAEITPPQNEPYKKVDLQEEPPKSIYGKVAHAVSKIIRGISEIIAPTNGIYKEIIINVETLETRVAVLEDGKLEEFTIERTNQERLAGSIFKAKVRNLEDGLKAAFVDIGYDKNAFLHYWDIIPGNLDANYELVEREGRRKEREKPKITQKDIPRLYPVGSDIVVQVTKGPIGTKGPRVTTNLVLPGRYLVLLPNSDQCGISRKIEDAEERQRLKKILQKLDIPEGMGVIIRTAGEGQKYRYFVRDLALLVEEWREIQNKIATLEAPVCVYQEPDLIERTVRDFLTEDVERVVIDDLKAYERVKQIVGKISKRSVKKIKYYNEAIPLFDKFGITKQLDEAFARQVNLKSGGYIVIDETEALVAIDVNTGKHKTDPKDQDSTILKVNLEAADEICRQLRLRNMGGLIVLDFIDMKSRRDQQAVYNRMRQNLKRDRAKTHILPISPLGLMEMTRQRHTESVRSSIYEDCPYCAGRSKVKSTLTMSVEIQRKLVEILKKRQREELDFNVRIIANPTVVDRMIHEDEKILIDLEKKYFCKINLTPDKSYHIEQFKIINETTNEELASSKLSFDKS
jgi:ribonuclease G